MTPSFVAPQQDAEKSRQLRSRIVQTLNVPSGYASALHSLRPCWTVFLSILWEVVVFFSQTAVRPHPLITKTSSLCCQNEDAIVLRGGGSATPIQDFIVPESVGKQHGVRHSFQNDGRRCPCAVCRKPYRGAVASTPLIEEYVPCLFDQVNPYLRWVLYSRRRNRGRTHTDADATAWYRLPWSACTRSRLRSGPC